MISLKESSLRVIAKNGMKSNTQKTLIYIVIFLTQKIYTSKCSSIEESEHNDKVIYPFHMW